MAIGRIGAAKTALFLIALLPLARLVAGALVWQEWLGANPAEYIVRSTGDWTLRILLATLAITPLRRWTGWSWLIEFRRMLGLFAFFYGLVHLSSYVAFDHVFEWEEIVKDIIKRPFITVGFASLVLMLPLAATSLDRMVRWMGSRRWIALHRVVYVVAPLAVLHFWWMVKRDLTEPIIYAAVLAVLLGARWFQRRRRPAARKAAPARA